ncbi:MAG: hypothetical protein ACRDDY_03315 [Clostridium sp.]|uniref:hypothetical protein n=1 Tax=Clostridium sp. TaxID=1506 RepID=UPI003EE78AF1
MRPYFSNYKGKVTKFRIVEVYEGNEEYDVLHLQNMENLSVTKLASNNVHCAKGEMMLVGDTIVKQYSREGFGAYSRYFGAYTSQGNTAYVDVSSYDRYNEKNPEKKYVSWIIIAVFVFIAYLIASQ